MQRQFPHDLFHIRPVLDVQPGKDFQRLFHLDDDIQPDQVALLQPARRLVGQVQHQRQERPVELEHVHPQAKGRNVGFARVADLAHGQFRPAAIVEQRRPLTDQRLAGNRGDAGQRQRAYPQMRAPPPVGAHRLADHVGPDRRQGQPMLGLVDHDVQMPPQRPRPAAPLPQGGQSGALHNLRLAGPAHQGPLVQEPVPIGRYPSCHALPQPSSKYRSSGNFAVYCRKKVNNPPPWLQIRGVTVAGSSDSSGSGQPRFFLPDAAHRRVSVAPLRRPRRIW